MAKLAGEFPTASSLGRYGHLDEAGDGSRRAFGLRRLCLGRRRPLFRAVLVTLLLAVVGTYYTSYSRHAVGTNSAPFSPDGSSVKPAISHSHEASQSFRPYHDAVLGLGGPTTDPVLEQQPPVHRPVPALSDRPGSLRPVDTSAPSGPFPAPARYNDCQHVPAEMLAKLQLATEPSVTVLSNGRVVTASTSIVAPAAVCILVAIPQTRIPDQNYTDAPVPGKGPDNIHLYLNATNVMVTFPPLDPLPGQPEASSLHISRGNSIVYYADTVLYTAGVYNIIGEQEFAHWFWAQEWTVIFHNIDPVTERPNTTIKTTSGVPPGSLYETHVFNPRPLPPASITVTGATAIPLRPQCSNTLNAGVGRWYKQSVFPDVLAKAMADEWGYIWQGDFCHLSHFTPAETVQCFENKNIQFYGDSMTRRMLKAIVAGGEWCHDLDDACQDADDGADGQIDTLGPDPGTGKLVHHSTPRGTHFQSFDRSPINFGRNSSAYFSFLTQLGHWPGDWMDRIYEASDLVVLKELGGPENNLTTNRAVKPGAASHARPPPESGPIDLVVMGFGAWDQAFTDRFDTYEKQLAEFRDAMITAYSIGGHETPIIMRMSNSWCCRDTENSFRRYTGSRVCEFDARTKKIFNYTNSGDAVSGRIMVVDPINMNGRADVLRDYPPSTANHPRASHVRLEMQMLMNSVCVRDKASGKVSLRER